MTSSKGHVVDSRAIPRAPQHGVHLINESNNPATGARTHAVSHGLKGSSRNYKFHDKERVWGALSYHSRARARRGERDIFDRERGSSHERHVRETNAWMKLLLDGCCAGWITFRARAQVKSGAGASFTAVGRARADARTRPLSLLIKAKPES